MSQDLQVFSNAICTRLSISRMHRPFTTTSAGRPEASIRQPRRTSIRLRRPSTTSGSLPRLCRVYRAKTRQSRTIIGFSENFMYGREFSSMDELNLRAREWLDTVNRNVHGTTHEIPFDRLPQENLRPFSSYPPYHVQKKYSRKVSRDCYLSLYGNLYSVPWRFAGSYVDVVVRGTTVLVSANGMAICSHPLLIGKDQRSRQNALRWSLKQILTTLHEPGRNDPEVVYRGIYCRRTESGSL